MAKEITSSAQELPAQEQGMYSSGAQQANGNLSTVFSQVELVPEKRRANGNLRANAREGRGGADA
jgi:hypothetical protein